MATALCFLDAHLFSISSHVIYLSFLHRLDKESRLGLICLRFEGGLLTLAVVRHGMIGNNSLLR